MAYKIEKQSEAVTEYLPELDGEGEVDEPTCVVLRHADGHDELRVEQLIASATYLYDMEGVGLVREIPPTPKYIERAAKVWAVLEACNIRDENDQPLLTRNMEWRAFQSAWARAGEAVRTALFKRVVKVNPHWGFPMSGGVL